MRAIINSDLNGHAENDNKIRKFSKYANSIGNSTNLKSIHVCNRNFHQYSETTEIIPQTFKLISFIIITIIIKGSDDSSIDQHIQSTGKADNMHQTENETNSSNVNKYFNELLFSFQSVEKLF